MTVADTSPRRLGVLEAGAIARQIGDMKIASVLKATAQAAALIVRAERLPEAAGARQGQSGSGPPLRLMILGDSSAAGVGVDAQEDALAGQLAAQLAQDFRLAWMLRARSGLTSRGACRMSLPAGPYDAVVTVLGVNDVIRLRLKRDFARDQRAVLTRLCDRLAPRQVYVCAVPPVGEFPLLPSPLRDILGARAAALDAALSTVCDDTGACHVPFDLTLTADLMARDGFHPSAKLYQLWAQRLAGVIRADFGAGGHAKHLALRDDS